LTQPSFFPRDLSESRALRIISFDLLGLRTIRGPWTDSRQACQAIADSFGVLPLPIPYVRHVFAVLVDVVFVLDELFLHLQLPVGHSLETFSNEEPRCPEAPKATPCSGTERSGASVQRAVTSPGTFISIDASAGIPPFS